MALDPQAQLIRWPVEVVRKLGNRVGVVANGAFGEAAKMRVYASSTFLHSQTDGSQSSFLGGLRLVGGGWPNEQELPPEWNRRIAIEIPAQRDIRAVNDEEVSRDLIFIEIRLVGRRETQVAKHWKGHRQAERNIKPRLR